MDKFLITDQMDATFFEVYNNYCLYDYNENNRLKIIKAYKLAKKLHAGIKRKSGEPYIIHPIEVARIGTSYNVDCDTICSCLLHDVVEDTDCTLDYISKEFGADVAAIVDCVTKIANMDFDFEIGKEELFAKNVRKIFKGLLYKDIRSIAVKLFDRLHNMRTLQYMKPEKQLEKSKQTMEVFVPIAQAIGANSIKKELQDLCMLYLHPTIYEQLSSKLKDIQVIKADEIEYIKNDLSKRISEENIPHEIKLRIKNIYNVFISLQKGRAINDIHDLFALQVNVNDIPSCYDTLRIIHSAGYAFVPDKLKDYIYMPKTTGYRALHTTLIDKQELMLQAQIRTYKMALTNTKGILNHLQKYSQEDLEVLKRNYPFFSKGVEIDTLKVDDQDFYNTLKYEVLGDKIYVRSASGKVSEMPVGSNIIDFAFLVCPNRAPYLTGGIINSKPVEITHQLKNQDLVTFTSDENINLDSTWAEKCKTTRARRLILDQVKKYNI